MPKPNLSTLTWPSMAAMVERILANRRIANPVTGAERPMRFVEFSFEIGVDNGLAANCVRGNKKPSDNVRAKVEAWCEKHFKHAKK